MTKQELKDVTRLLDSMAGLLETGFFPGKKAPKVLDALRYIHLMRQEINGQLKDSKAENTQHPQDDAAESERSAT